MASARSDSVVATRFAAEAGMMGRLNHDQGQLFYSFSLEEAVPDDHLVREIAAVLDLAWVRVELAPYYSSTGRPSIDPELMIRMLIIGCVFAIRSERALCRDVQVNFACRWFCGLSIEDKVPDHSAFSRARNERFRASDIFRSVSERVVGDHGWAGFQSFDDPVVAPPFASFRDIRLQQDPRLQYPARRGLSFPNQGFKPFAFLAAQPHNILLYRNRCVGGHRREGRSCGCRAAHRSSSREGTNRRHHR